MKISEKQKEKPKGKKQPACNFRWTIIDNNWVRGCYLLLVTKNLNCFFFFFFVFIHDSFYFISYIYIFISFYFISYIYFYFFRYLFTSIESAKFLTWPLIISIRLWRLIMCKFITKTYIYMCVCVSVSVCVCARVYVSVCVHTHAHTHI